MGATLSCMTKDGASKTSKPNEKHREIHKEEVPVCEAEKRCVQVKLPHNYQDIIQDADSPIDRSSIDKLYEQLCSGIFLNKNTKKYWIEKDSGANSFMLFARNMDIEWIEKNGHWKWTPVKETSACDVMVDAAELLDVCWLEVKATFHTEKLSPGNTYEVSFAIMLKDESYGWEVPVYLEMELENGIKLVRRENLFTKPRNRWIEIPVAEFITAPENDGQMKITLYETSGGQWKRGLIIKRILIQPKI